MNTRTRHHHSVKNGGAHLAAQAQSAIDDVTEIAKDARDTAFSQARNMYETAQEKVVSGAKTADRVIRTNPYKSIGIAFGIGLLLGYLRKRD